MKRLLLILLVIGGLNQTIMADSIVLNRSGQLKYAHTQDTHTRHLLAGDYRYELTLTGNNKAKTRLRINQDQWVNSQIGGDDTVRRSQGRNTLSAVADTIVKKKLLDKQNMYPDKTFKGTFHVYVENTSMQTTNKREVRAKVSKPAGGRTLNYTLKIYKVTTTQTVRGSTENARGLNGMQKFTRPTINSHRVDWCKNWGQGCGKPAATYFCKQKGFVRAHEWIEDKNIGNTIVLGDNKICNMAGCDGFKSITCDN